MWAIGNRIAVGTLLFAMACAAPRTGRAAEMLGDPRFDQSSNDGTFPDSGYWQPSRFPAGAGAVCTSTAGRFGSNGLWAFSEAGSAEKSWSAPYQQFPALPADVYNGRAWIRSAPSSSGGSWAAGSKACVRVEFRNTSDVLTAFYESDSVPGPDSNWAEFPVTTDPAPSGTAFVRFVCYVEKPNDGTAGQAVANFDECSLEFKGRDLRPGLSLAPFCIGFVRDQTQRTFTIRNNGQITLLWQATSFQTWVESIAPQSGELSDGQEVEVTVTVNRAGLDGELYKGAVDVTSDQGRGEVTVYMDMPNGHDVPPAPSLVAVNGYRLMVQNRLPGGALSAPKHYVVRGAAWSPASIGDDGSLAVRRGAFEEWYVADVPLLKEMYGNTVYTFLDFGTGQAGTDILNYLYKNRIMAIVTVDENGSNSTPTISTVVNAYKNHPAVLAWAIGNEWNINYYHGKFGDPNDANEDSLDRAARATEAAALQIKALDRNHPVVSIYGEIDIPANAQPLSKTQEIVNTTCPSVDVWGLNTYRGPTFGNLFSQWKSISAKPMMLSEFGTDSYHTKNWWDPLFGIEDETTQAEFDAGLWQEIAANLSAERSGNVCIGGCVFEWNDEWWKVGSGDGGSPDTHDNGGFETTWNPGAHPDGFANEEYFGIVDIHRRRKAAYDSLQDLFERFTSARKWGAYR